TACVQAPAAETTTSTSIATTTTTTSLGAADIYALVSPSLAFVETRIGTGSAVLVEPTTLVTNAHVVWPDTHAAVSFPNGTSGTAAVVGYDWMADLAVLDVSDIAGLPGHAVLDTSVRQPGEPVYLVGYPADDASSAVPAITAGIVSRTRVWEAGGMTFIQSDALISGGQSGGALVDDRGRVIGISGLSVGEGFALALTAADLEARLDGIRGGTGGDGLGDRSFEALAGPVVSNSSVSHLLDETVFVFEAVAGDTVTIELTADTPFNADLVGPDGFVEASNDRTDTTATLEAELVLDGPYFVVVYPEDQPIGRVDIGGVDARTWTDPDHGRLVTIGTPLAGNGDYPGDLDWFQLDLTAGQTVTITVSSINIDAALLVDLLNPVDGSAFASDSDSGGGVIGYDARVVFTAPETASYAVAVFDETGFGPGGYMLTVAEGRP
ncbi:MAG: serine protease, partial [Acidimicrobiia bacterium]|nr:serine protease [Acidimicrobiia bacterium]